MILIQAFNGFAGAGLGGFVVFTGGGEGESAVESGAGVGGAVGGEVGEAELEVVRGDGGREGDGAFEVFDGFGNGSVGKGSVDDADEEAGSRAEGGDLVVPASEDMVGPVVVGVEGEGALGVFLDEARVGDLGAGVAVNGEGAVADGEGENVFGVVGGKGDGA